MLWSAIGVNKQHNEIGERFFYGRTEQHSHWQHNQRRADATKTHKGVACARDKLRAHQCVQHSQKSRYQYSRANAYLKGAQMQSVCLLLARVSEKAWKNLYTSVISIHARNSARWEWMG